MFSIRAELIREIEEREALAEHIARQVKITLAQALDWLDAQDAVAIETAERILAAEPYTDIPVPYTLH